MSSNQKEIFSKNLKRLVTNSNLSQREIAISINVSPQTFNTWINGIAIPRMTSIQLLADYFNVEKSDLIENENVLKMEHHDISLIINQLTNILKSTQKVMYNGVPMDEITKELVYSSIEQAARIADANNKKSKINKI